MQFHEQNFFIIHITYPFWHKLALFWIRAKSYKKSQGNDLMIFKISTLEKLGSFSLQSSQISILSTTLG